LKFYLAYSGETPVAQAILDCRNDTAYLASASTLPEWRRRGFQSALIRRRLADARALGCRVVFGGADFESSSRTNQMACGLQVAYTAAWWCQPEARIG
jgi:ribosomal protein S18 acetylase RimI-like enzyme